MDGQPQEPQKHILLQDVEFGLGGIMLGAVFFLLFFLILNYLNILRLSELYPNQLGFLPHRPASPASTRGVQRGEPYQAVSQPIKTTVSPTPSFLNNPLVAKSKAIGYNIIWMDPNDTTGRTVLYDQRNAPDNGIGEHQIKNTDGSLYVDRITGIIQEIKDIPKSPDKYMVLINPQTKQSYQPFRIILDPEEASTLSAKLTLPFTQLFIENLDVLANVSAQNEKLLAEFRKFSTDEVQRILNKDDAISAVLWPTYGVNNKSLVNAKDESGYNSVWKLYIRRFGGKEQIEKELGKSL